MLVASDEATAGSVIAKQDLISPFSSGRSQAWGNAEQSQQDARRSALSAERGQCASAAKLFRTWQLQLGQVPMWQSQAQQHGRAVEQLACCCCREP